MLNKSSETTVFNNKLCKFIASSHTYNVDGEEQEVFEYSSTVKREAFKQLTKLGFNNNEIELWMRAYLEAVYSSICSLKNQEEQLDNKCLEGIINQAMHNESVTVTLALRGKTADIFIDGRKIGNTFTLFDSNLNTWGATHEKRIKYYEKLLKKVDTQSR